MTTFQDLKTFLERQKIRLITVADAEPRVQRIKNGKILSEIPAGGVGIALDPISRAAKGMYIARGKNEDEKKIGDKDHRTTIEHPDGKYTLRRVFLSEEEMKLHYYGFANQTLWPLSHVAFEAPIFHKNWYEGYKKINQRYAKAVADEIKGKTFVWLHDYHLALVPKYLGKQRDTTVAMFWHIPWPTWEVFRILPQKREILESLLQNDFLAFHRGYHVRNFLDTVGRELEARIDEETNRVYYNKHVTVVKNLPLGIDADVIQSLVLQDEQETFLTRALRNLLQSDQKESRVGSLAQNPSANSGQAKHNGLTEFFQNYKVILGVDRLDYTKGLVLRLRAIDRFFEKHPAYIGKAVYLGILAPSRELIPSYQRLKREVKEQAEEINRTYKKGNWQPIRIISEVFPRKDVINFFQKSQLCLVTPRDDGMNLVSKEFVLASSFSENPGMLVLSTFAGSAIDLTQSLIVNPYDIDEVSSAIKRGLEMSQKEKRARIKAMAEVLEERNIYEWAQEFVRNALTSGR